MTKPEWGTKRICGSCAAHFYDMRKATIVCPKCKTVYDPDAVMKSRRRVAEKMTPVKAAVVDDPVADVEADVEEEDIGDEEDVVLEDASELGEDDEDISEAIEKGEDEGER
nr:TIGR02300 family protein [uncultured Dongia sp.]